MEKHKTGVQSSQVGVAPIFWIGELNTAIADNVDAPQLAISCPSGTTSGTVFQNSWNLTN